MEGGRKEEGKMVGQAICHMQHGSLKALTRAKEWLDTTPLQPCTLPPPQRKYRDDTPCPRRDFILINSFISSLCFSELE